MTLTSEAIADALVFAGLRESVNNHPGFVVYSSGRDFVAAWISDSVSSEREHNLRILNALRGKFNAERHGDFSVLVRRGE